MYLSLSVVSLNAMFSHEVPSHLTKVDHSTLTFFHFVLTSLIFSLFPGSSHVGIIFLETPYFLATFDVLFLNPPQLLFHIFPRLTIYSSLNLSFFTICNCSVTTM